MIPASVVALMQGALARTPEARRPEGRMATEAKRPIRSRPRPSFEEGWVQGLVLLVPLA